MRSGKFNIVIGAQAGSEAKGKFSAWLAEKHSKRIGALFMAASPNAGHTLVGTGMGHYVSHHVPVAAVVTGCPIYLGPTSVINPDVFVREIQDLGIDPDRIRIDPRASVIREADIREENSRGLSDIGSTLQGVGVARMVKMMRGHGVRYAMETPELGRFIWSYPVSQALNGIMEMGGAVLAEMTQGFDLDLEHGISPRYCTSKMINPAMCMAEAGISPRFLGDVHGVIRPYPIRVNNRTGTSGPYTGSEEITWARVAEMAGCTEDLTEYTTTTKLPRRVFTFSWERYRKFIEVCRPDALCLQFANYLNWNDLGVTDKDRLSAETLEFVHELERVGNCPVVAVGTGPGHDQMVDMKVPVGRWE